jgi:hypothetical protein
MTNDPAYYRDLLNRILKEDDDDDDIPTPPSRRDIKREQLRRHGILQDPLIKKILRSARQEGDGIHLHLDVGPEIALRIIKDFDDTSLSNGTYYLRLDPDDFTDQVPQTYIHYNDDPDEDEEYSDDELGFQIREGNQEAIEAWFTFVETKLKHQIEENISRIYNLPSGKLDYIEGDTYDSFFFECRPLTQWLAKHLKPLQDFDLSLAEIQQYLKDSQ